MRAERWRRPLRTLPWLLLVGSLLTILYLMGQGGGKGGFVDRHFVILLLVNGGILLLLLAWIAQRLFRLLRDIRRNRPGARLSARMVALLTLLTLPPMLAIFWFSVQFLGKGLDRWFDVRVDQALNNAMSLAQLYIDEHATEALRRTRQVAEQIRHLPDEELATALVGLVESSQADELLLLDEHGRLLASSVLEPTLAPAYPPAAALLTVRQTGVYSNLEQDQQGRLIIRVLLSVHRPGQQSLESRLLQGIYRVRPEYARLALPLEEQFQAWHNLLYLRDSLRWTFMLILLLVLLYGFTVSLLAGFGAARRLFLPLARLAEATRKVAQGQYRPIPALPTRDELGQLVQAFNSMTLELEQARQKDQAYQQRIERSNRDLASVLTNLESAVALFDDHGRLLLKNPRFEALTEGQTLEEILWILGREPAAFLQQLQQGPLEESLSLNDGRHWRLRAQRLAGQELGGMVLVLDDITLLVAAQRAEAWGEVARRFAHEIKNPLTPIQLAAERLRHKLHDELPPEQQPMLQRATGTIINQVKALKNMVDEFSAYARKPRQRLEPLNLATLVDEVLELYRQSGAGHRLRLQKPSEPCMIEGDADRMRQLIHNLVKNAIEAAQPATCTLEITLEQDSSHCTLRFCDTGPGFDPALEGRLFEPYATTKHKGTGLGLAIVRQIVESHGGHIRAWNREAGGACVEITLPTTSG